MNRSSSCTVLLLLTLCMPLLAAGQSPIPAPATRLSGIIPKLAEGARVMIRLVSIPGGATVVGGGSGDGTLDLGKVSYFSSSNVRAEAKRSQDYSTTASRFGIEVDAPTARLAGPVTLSAYLAEPSPHCAYLIDGIRLTTAPQVISPRLAYGMITEHRLEIQVPKTAPPGLKQVSIVWIAAPEE